MTNKDFMRILHARGIRMQDVAESLEMSAGYLTLIIQGRRKAPTWFYRKLCRLYPFFSFTAQNELIVEEKEAPVAV